MSLRALARHIPFVRGLAHEVSPYHAGGVLENLLGYQVVRTIGKNLSIGLRSRPPAAEASELFKRLDRDGVVTIPDFLPLEKFREVRAEYDRVRAEFVFKPFRDATEARLHVARFPVSDNLERFPSTLEHLLKSETILGLVCAVTRIHFTPTPYAEIAVYRKASDEAPDNDIENVLHADVHYPTVKAFYYLSDVSAANGAFVYAKGSHRLTMSRLAHEYDLSVRTAKLTAGRTDIPANLLAKRGEITRAVVAPRVLQKMNVEEASMSGKANTLIIANNMGFHRRGEFTGPDPREVLLINFRYLKGRPRAASM